MSVGTSGLLLQRIIKLLKASFARVPLYHPPQAGIQHVGVSNKRNEKKPREATMVSLNVCGSKTNGPN